MYASVFVSMRSIVNVFFCLYTRWAVRCTCTCVWPLWTNVEPRIVPLGMCEIISNAREMLLAVASFPLNCLCFYVQSLPLLSHFSFSMFFLLFSSIWFCEMSKVYTRNLCLRRRKVLRLILHYSVLICTSHYTQGAGQLNSVSVFLSFSLSLAIPLVLITV